MSYTNKKTDLPNRLTYRQNLDRPMTAKELDTNFLNISTATADVTDWINEVGQQVDTNDQSVQNSVKNLNDAITGLGKDLENGLTKVDAAHTKTEDDIKTQIADILKRLAEVEKKLGGSKTDS